MASKLPDEHPQPITPPLPTKSTESGGMSGRIKNLLLNPTEEWARIDVEPMTAAQVFRGWAVPLAAIGPVASLIGQQLLGWSFLGIHYRPSLTGSLTSAVLGYLAALAGVWVLALVIEAFAPTFQAVKSRDQAMKVAAFSYTAAWIAAILQILPSLSVIGVVLGLYSFYLLWVGLPKLMKVTPDKAPGYVVVSVVASIVVYLVIGAIVGVITNSLMRPAYDLGGGTVTLGSVNTPNGTNLDLNKLAAAGEQMAAAADRSAAQANGGTATGALIAPDALQAMLPATVAGFTRTEVESSGGSAGGVGGATAKGTYTLGDQQFELSVSDIGALGNLATLGGAVNVNSNKQTATGYEKTTMQNGNMVEEDWDTADHHGKYSMMVVSRFAIEAEGDAPSIEPLKSAVAAIDVGRLAALAK